VSSRPLGWLGIVRLGLVQTALGSIVVLTTSTMNRVMVVELALPAMLPGVLVALHYAIQMSRPRLGFGSDVGGRRTPWIIGGMAVLCAGGVGAALAIALMATHPAWGVASAVVAFVLIGLGVGASGTTLLVLLAKRVDESRRAAAATITWIMMIAGFIVTAALAGHFLDPFSSTRLVVVTAAVAALAFAVTVAAVWNMEGARQPGAAEPVRDAPPPFRVALAQVWREPLARQFAIFVFVSMLAYSLQDLILEPFAGLVFGYTPGESTQLSSFQHGGVLLGMLCVAASASLVRSRRSGSMRVWIVGGCLVSALALLGLAVGGLVGPGWPLRSTVFLLGAANGAFAVAAIGSMMALAARGTRRREGLRMGLWGAAQAIAFGLGGFLGTLASDIARWLLPSVEMAYATVFTVEAVLFVFAAVLAARLALPGAARAAPLINPMQPVRPAPTLATAGE
jgi:BCD family chlorophyll transporter-like MFS transporter